MTEIWGRGEELREAWWWLLLSEEAWLLSLVEDRLGADTPWLGPHLDWRGAREQLDIPGHRAGVCWGRAEGSPSEARWWWGQVSVSDNPSGPGPGWAEAVSAADNPSVLQPRSSACSLGLAPGGLRGGIPTANKTLVFS